MIVSCRPLLATKVVLFKSLSLFKIVPSKEVVCHRYGKLGRSGGSVIIICWLEPPAATNSHCPVVRDTITNNMTTNKCLIKLLCILFYRYLYTLSNTYVCFHLRLHSLREPKLDYRHPQTPILFDHNRDDILYT